MVRVHRSGPLTIGPRAVLVTIMATAGAVVSAGGRANAADAWDTSERIGLLSTSDDFAGEADLDDSFGPQSSLPTPLLTDEPANVFGLRQPDGPWTHPIFADAPTAIAGDEVASHLSVTGSYLYGPVGGFVQIARGGKKHSTTLRRPRFAEMGLNDTNIADGQIDYQFDANNDIFLGAQINNLNGSGVIHPALTSHGVSFPNGTHVSSGLRFNWYRLGYRYNFILNTADNGVPDLTLSPYIDVLLWDFAYNLNGGSISAGHPRVAGRSFDKTGFQVGAVLAWRPGGGPLSFEANLASFPPASSLATISVEQLIARYHFYQYRGVDFSVHAGVAWEQQDFYDAQKVQNRISNYFGPMLIAGLQIRY